MLLRLLRDIWNFRHSRHVRQHGDHTPAYSPMIFHADSLKAAKAIILTPTPDMTTDERWEVETKNLTEELGRTMGIGPDSRILDYGCGIGRVAKALIDRFGCSVVGVDISAEMRQLAVGYVNSDRFVACDRATLSGMIEKGFRATGACACWVLQHCETPAQDIELIESALAPGAPFFVLNSDHRWVPTDQGWAKDDVSIEDLLSETFERVSKTGVDHLVGSGILAAQSYAMLFRAKEIKGTGVD